jgi:hypothetical protein
MNDTTYEYPWDREDETEFTRRLKLVSDRQFGQLSDETLLQLSELIVAGHLDVTEGGVIIATSESAKLANSVIETLETL